MKRPEILDVDVKLVDNAVTLWRAGELVAMPTETVYGLGADATNGQAVAKIYSMKARPQFNPLIVHVADVTTAKKYVQWNDTAEKLAAAFWPGPLTLVLKRRIYCHINELVSAGGSTLAIRIPSHPVAQQLLKAFGGGIAAPSANRSGRISPTTAQHVRDELGDAVKLVVDGGPCEIGLESTVVDLSGEAPTVLRPGSITRAAIEAVLFTADEANEKKAAHAARQELRLADTDGGELKSPGMMETHYAPELPVRMNAETVDADEALLAFGPTPIEGAATTLNLSETGDMIEAAANLFAYMRLLDVPAHRAIAVMPIDNTGIGEAINDRLWRASAARR
jgi:L-threonylcarbamoyladenylate synthase